MSTRGGLIEVLVLYLLWTIQVRSFVTACCFHDYRILSRNSISEIESDAFNPTGSLQNLHLQSNRLSYVNRLVFAGPLQLESLHLYANEITGISNGAFYRLSKLEKLSLHSNRITVVRKETFVGMDSLQELVLYNNLLTNLTVNSFAQLTNLRRLWLHGNQISCMEPNCFNGLKKLDTLQLSSNRISYIPDQLFQYTPNLLYLFLYDNDITSIGNTPFKNLPRLVQLSIYYNPIEYMTSGALEGTDNLYYLQWSDFGGDNHLVCDCGALWLYDWMTSHPLQSSVICASPAQHNGVDVRALQRGSFGCGGAVLSVEVGPDCVHHVVPQGGCLRLTCSSSPRGLVHWSRLDGQEIRRKPNTCSLSDRTPSECPQGGGGDGVLVVEAVESEDAGYYLCTAHFQNITRSQICRVVIGVPPTMDRPPADIILASPGPAVAFSLMCSGSPHPNVTWYWVSPHGTQLLLNEEGLQSRYLVSEAGSLVLLQTVAQDAGVYRVVVSNGAGQVSADAHLSFHHTDSCRRDCLNGGHCVQLSLCACVDGYTGRQCEEVIGTVEPMTTQTTPTTVTDEDHEGLIDDEDYYDSSNETSGSGSGDGTLPPPTTDAVMGGAVGGASQPRHTREARWSVSDGFQNQLRRILTEEEAVRQEVGVVRASHYGNNERGWSQPEHIAEILSPLPRRRLDEDTRDVFGMPVLFEYTDPVDVYSTVPKSK